MRPAFTSNPENVETIAKRFQSLFIGAEDEKEIAPIWQGPRPSSAAGLQEVESHFRKAIETNRDYLPLWYREAFVEPLLRNLGRVLRSSDDPSGVMLVAECLAGAVVQHAPESSVRQPLRQFLAVVSNLYRSFSEPGQRESGVASAPRLPPLVCIHHRTVTDKLSPGPAVLTSPVVEMLCASRVAVVVMPSGLQRSPLSWIPLAHEAGGHGILQGVPGLLAELAAGVRALFGGGRLEAGDTPTREQEPGLLWSYWIEEAAADIYGILNVGPTFALNLAAFIAARRMSAEGNEDAPFSLLNQAGRDPRVELGVHPIELLRLYVAVGAVESLTGLAPRRVRAYVRAIEAVAERCARSEADRGARIKVRVRGKVAVTRAWWVTIDREWPLREAAEAARRVGAFIASAKMSSFGAASVQEIETWDESDEQTALAVCEALLNFPEVRLSVDKPPVSISEALKQAGVKSAKDEEVVKARLVDDDFTALTPEHKLALGLGNLTEDDFGNLTRNRIEKLGLAATLSLNLDRVVGMGNDAHLLAGGMLAVLERPDPATFRWVNRLLAFALQRSHQLDPIMGFAELHRMFDSDLNLEQTSLQSRGFSDVRIAPHLPEDKPGA